jgi:hypothetical protein
VTKPKVRSGRKLVAVLGIMLLFALGFFVLGMGIDIQIILEYNYTPVPFTFVLPFVGALIGFVLASRAIGDKLTQKTHN